MPNCINCRYNLEGSLGYCVCLKISEEYGYEKCNVLNKNKDCKQFEKITFLRPRLDPFKGKGWREFVLESIPLFLIILVSCIGILINM
jgi:hypothetical protein